MSEPIAVRQAALLLHGLTPAVRRAVLAKLDGADADRLQRLLSELAEMGVSPSLGRRLNATLASPADSSPEQKAARLNGDAVADALGACAPVTIAQLLRSREWPWKSQALARLSEGVRAAVVECMRRELPALGPAAVRRLCERVCKDVERASAASSHQASEGATNRKSRLARIFRWTR
jgi:hypothetical protein